MRNFIIFDIGGVLRIYNNSAFNDWLKTTFNITKAIEPIWKKWQDLRDIDEIDEHEFYSNFLKDVELDNSKLSEHDFYKKFFDDCVTTNHDLFNFIEKRLYGIYKLCIFSNMSRIEVREHKKKIDYEKYFDKCIYSYMIKTLKPDINFFKKGLKLIGHAGEECIYIDDKIKNKENSEKVGIKFIQYIDYDNFIESMKSLKLIQKKR